MLTLTPLLKVKVYVHKNYLNKVLFNVGREGIIHLIDVREEFPEEVAKGLVKPFEVSTRLYRISTLASKVDKLISTLNLTPKESLEDFNEDELSSFSLSDAEALADSIERLTSTADESLLQKIRSEYGEQLLKLRLMLRIIEALESAKTKMAETATTALFSGWIPKESLKRFIELVDKASNGNSIIKYEEPKIRAEEEVRGKVEKEKLEVLTLRFYVPKKYIDDVAYSLSEVEHSLVDLKDVIYTEFREKAKPLEPSPRLFKLSSLSSRLDVILSSLGLQSPEDIKPLSKPLPDEKINEVDSFVSSIESEIFSITSRLESIKKSMEVASKVESEVASITLPQVPITEAILHDVKGPLKSIMLQLSDEMVKLHSSLDKIRSEKGQQLIEYKRIIEGARLVEERKLKMAATDNIAILQVIVTKENLENLINTIKQATQGNFTYKEVVPLKKVKVKKEVKAEARREVKIPSLMKNPSWARVYEGLVRGFGTLNYREIDPTVIWFFTFPIFFGLMFPDVGHGIVLLVLSLPLYYLKKKGFKGGELTGYIVQGAPLLIASAIASIFFGVVFGECFGNPNTPGYPLPNIFNNEALNEFRAAVLRALGLSSTHHFHLMEPEGAKALLKLSIYIGIFHITLGLIFSVINKIRLKEYKEAVIGPGLWLWLYISASTAFILYGGKVINIIFSDIVQSFIFVWLPFIVMLIVRMIYMGAMDGFTESLDSLIASLSNTISYARLFAFAITHVVLAYIFVLIDVGLQNIAGIPFVGIISGTIFFVFFEIIFVFLQALRLHWVEHGLKFLIANGVPFQPFTIKP